MQNYMSDYKLLQTYHQLLPDLKIAVSTYLELLAQQSKQAIQQSVTNKKKVRKLGGLEGKIFVPADFDEPLDDFKDYM